MINVVGTFFFVCGFFLAKKNCHKMEKINDSYEKKRTETKWESNAKTIDGLPEWTIDVCGWLACFVLFFFCFLFVIFASKIGHNKKKFTLKIFIFCCCLIMYVNIWLSIDLWFFFSRKQFVVVLDWFNNNLLQRFFSLYDSVLYAKTKMQQVENWIPCFFFLMIMARRNKK